MKFILTMILFSSYVFAQQDSLLRPVQIPEAKGGETLQGYLPVSLIKGGLYSGHVVVLPKIEPVAIVDSNNKATIPAGWSWIIILKDGQLWSFDSTRSQRKLSEPNSQNYWR